MNDPTVDFRRFFDEVHRPENAIEPVLPFPWQEALLDRVMHEGWPQQIDVPTGLGKTSVLDVAVFASALDGPPARRRVFFVVDRRLVVDEAFEHAMALSTALAHARPGTVAAEVAGVLRADGDDVAIEATRMRGGLTWASTWLERPDRHAIVVGTVDQIGSRFFFRGYGISERQRPIDAALVGTDSLIIVDESHLADAFLRSLTAADADATPPELRPIVVAMSASSGGGAVDTHGITDRDWSHRVARRRLTAPKRLHLAEVKTTKKNTDEVMSAALAAWARHLSGHGRLIGIVCNTVARARAVFEELRAGAQEHCVLLTGRIRPVDRDYLLARWYGQIKAGRERTNGEPIYVVATQTIEVGANIDLDGLVTEATALPALVQRLGRLNRLGDLPAAHAVVLYGTADSDGVYGSARAATWEWLADHSDVVTHAKGGLPELSGGGLDVCPAELRRLTGALDEQAATAFSGPQPYGPVLFPVVLDSWARTSPPPSPDPPVAPYLHGLDHGAADVSVVWRSDVAGIPHELWPMRVALLPPVAEEAIDLPLPTVRRWLARLPGGDVLADVEGETIPDSVIPPSRHVRVLRYSPDGKSAVISSGDIRPGDLIVVPAEFGGCDQYGWAPSSTRVVTDVGDIASSTRRRVAVRLGPALIQALGEYGRPELADGMAEILEEISGAISADQPAPSATVISEAIGKLLTADDHELAHGKVLAALAGRSQIVNDDDPEALMLTTGTQRHAEDHTVAGSSWAGRPITLAAHQRAVRARAEEFARNLGLAPASVHAVGCAAQWHDEGKRDQRFQAMLHRGDQVRAAAANEPLAKSGMDPADRQALRIAHERSGYPPGMRHEALSARITAYHLAALTGQDGIDRDLVAHLVAAHHGHSRPLLPPVADPEPTITTITVDGNDVALGSAETVDWSAPRRFAALNARYGRWGLARLEAIVRLADIWCSVHEEPHE